jgi:hypothetical protein
VHEDRVSVVAPEDDVGGPKTQMQRPGKRATPNEPQRASGAQSKRRQPLPERKVAMHDGNRGVVAGDEVNQGRHGAGASEIRYQTRMIRIMNKNRCSALICDKISVP